jgi:hypothetical protein
MKYDFLALRKYMFPTFAAMIILAGILGIMTRLHVDESVNVLFVFICILYVASLIAGVVLLIAGICYHFYHTFYGSEAYLTFSLPASTAEHLASKTLTALIWTFIGVLICMGSFAVFGVAAASFKDLLEFTKEVFRLLLRIPELIIFDSLWVVITVILSLLSSITELFAAISTGHLVKEHPVLAGFGAYIVLAVIRSLAFNNLFDAVSGNTVYILMLCEIVWIALTTAIAWYISEKHLNLE